MNAGQMIVQDHNREEESFSVQRLRCEFRDASVREEIDCGIKIAKLDRNNFKELRGEITGPPGSPYEGGTFELMIKIPDNYPWVPPKVRFATKIWHPNVSAETGVVDEKYMQDNWMVSYTLSKFLLSLQMFLASTQPVVLQNEIAAIQCQEDPDLFTRTAKYWTFFHAGGPWQVPEFDEKVQCLIEMGVEKRNAFDMLSRSEWNLENAVQQLLN